MASQESRSVDDVGVAATDELDEVGILLRRVLEVGILDDHDVAGHLVEARTQRRALALVRRLQHEREPQLALQALKKLPRAVRRSIVDDDQLDAKGYGHHATDDFVDGVTLVV